MDGHTESINDTLVEAIVRETLIAKMPQCRAITLADRRCLRQAESPNGLCGIHDPTRQCHGWNYKRDRQCGQTCLPDDDLCATCQREIDEHER